MIVVGAVLYPEFSDPRGAARSIRMPSTSCSAFWFHLPVWGFALLSGASIVVQIMVARDRLNDWADRETPTGSRLVTSVVMLGMGEPLCNFDAVRDALLIVADNEGIGISRRRITLSTSAWCRTSSDRRRDRRHAGDLAACGARRAAQRLVPLTANIRSPIAAGRRDYPGSSNARRITFEYVMLKGVNDSMDDAELG